MTLFVEYVCIIYVYIKTTFNIILNILNINQNRFQLESRKTTGYRNKRVQIKWIWLFQVQFK